MPRKPAADIDTLEHEIDATTIALEVRKKAASFVGATRGWDEELPALRARKRALDLKRLRIQVTRDHINRDLDPACVEFLADLRHRVKGNRNHPDYAMHVSVAPSDFVRQDFDDQIREVKRWLVIDHSALAPYKALFAEAVADAEALVIAEIELSKEVRIFEADLEAATTTLTAKRDALHRRLGDYANDNGLERTWADGFFLRG